MKRPWTSSELEMLQEMATQQLPHVEIARLLGRSLRSVRTKLQYLKRSHECRAKEREKERQRYAAKNPYALGVEDRENIESRPTELMWFALHLRLSSPFRDLTGILQGDPRAGYSALDWRVTA